VNDYLNVKERASTIYVSYIEKIKEEKDTSITEKTYPLPFLDSMYYPNKEFSS